MISFLYNHGITRVSVKAADSKYDGRMMEDGGTTTTYMYDDELNEIISRAGACTVQSNDGRTRRECSESPSTTYDGESSRADALIIVLEDLDR